MFELLENMSRRERSDKHEEENKIILVFFKLFERKCHTTRSAG